MMKMAMMLAYFGGICVCEGEALLVFGDEKVSGECSLFHLLLALHFD
jgi:hypothetical protein